MYWIKKSADHEEFFFFPIKIVNLINLYYKLERQTFGE
jgi:hypothetical protein